MEPQYRSKTLGNVLYLLLWVAFSVSFLSLIFTIPYMVNYDFYYQYLANMDYFFIVLYFGLFFFLTILFLIWIFRVHTALRHLADYYPLRSGEVLSRLLIPLVQIWGWGNVFHTMSEYMMKNIPDLQSEGKKLGQLTRLGYLFFFAILVISNQPDSASMTLMMGICTSAILLIFIHMTRLTLIFLHYLAYTAAAEQEETSEGEAALPITDKQIPSV